jgi:hypothetical protein
VLASIDIGFRVVYLAIKDGKEKLIEEMDTYE